MSDSLASSRRTGQLLIAALVVAVVALAVAVFALVRSPSSDQAWGAGGDQSADPKARVCDAFAVVRNAVSLQTNANLGSEPVAVQAVAANARLATLGGGQFLLSRLDGDVPSDLADAGAAFATNLEYIGMGQLAGAAADDPNQVRRMTEAQTTATRISELCE